MRILLQHVRSRLYFCLLDVWVKDPHGAYDFRHSQRAFEFVQSRDLKDVQLVIKFEDPQWDEIVPVPLRVAAISSAVTA